MNAFLRLTILIAAGLVALVLLAIVLKVVIVAAVLAGLVIGTLFLLNLVRRRFAPSVAPPRLR